MEELKIVKEVLPVIEVNFEEIKTALTDTLKKYDGLVITEETLSGCKATQKELAGVRTKLDTYRKDKKKELSEPITAFENQCKELIALVEKAEAPIKEGIKVFDDKKRDAKRLEAEGIIKEVITEQGLNEKYAARLEVAEKYCNLTAKASEVRTDVEQRAFALKVEWDREKELLEIIQDGIDTENQRIKKQLSISDFDRLMRAGASTKDILAEIRLRADGIYEAENPKPVEPIIEAVVEAVPQVEKPQEPQAEPKAEEEPTYCVVYRVTDKLSKLKGVSEYLKANGITYKVTEQNKL